MGHSASHQHRLVDDPRIIRIEEQIHENLEQWFISFMEYRRGNQPIENTLSMPRVTEVTLPDFSHGLSKMDNREVGEHIMAQKPHDDIKLRLSCATTHEDYFNHLRVTNLTVKATHSRDQFNFEIRYDIYLRPSQNDAVNVPSEPSHIPAQSDVQVRMMADDSSDSSSDDDIVRYAASASDLIEPALPPSRSLSRSLSDSDSDSDRIKIQKEPEIRKPSLIANDQEAMVNMGCKVCFEKKCNIVLEPCGHVVICSDCVKGVDKCPNCRTPIQMKIPFIVS